MEHRISGGTKVERKSMRRWSLLLLVGLCSFALLTGLAFAQKAAAPSKAEPTPAPKAAVSLGGTPLFYVQERVLSFSPEDRAAAITDRIVRISKNPLIRISAIAVSEGDGSTDIVAGDTVIMSVTDIDARSAGKPRAELANEYAERIRAAIESNRREHSWRTIAKGVGLTILTTIVLFVLIRLLNHFYPKLYATIGSWQHTRIRSIRIQKFELFPAERITALLISVARLARVLLVVVLIYFYLSLIFWDDRKNADAFQTSMFPKMVEKLTPMIQSPPRVEMFEVATTTFAVPA